MIFLKTFLTTLVIILVLEVGKVQAQQSQNQNYQSVLEVVVSLLLGGGAGAGSSWAITKSSSNQQTDSEDINEDYKNSPEYLKDKIIELEEENQKLKNSVNSLRRRFNYIDSRLARINKTYISYDERHPPKATE